jgi:hypothetical protein
VRGIIRNAVKYAYWTVICATPGCFKRHFAKFIGEDRESGRYALEGDLPVTFFHQCQKCGKVHTYIPSDLVPCSVDALPLSGLREWW